MMKKTTIMILISFMIVSGSWQKASELKFPSALSLIK